MKLLTPSRKNIKDAAFKGLTEKELLSLRGLIETVNDQLKNLHQVEHSRYGSVYNCMVNIMVVVVVYCLNPNKSTFKSMIAN